MSKEISCDLCPNTFTSRNGLSHHMKTHSWVKKYNCPQCNKSFGLKGNLKKHALIHKHKRTQCNFSCKHSSDLKTHIKKHTGEKLNQAT